MELVVFIGIQASGKSTFFRERFFDTHVRINLDMLRTRNRERILVRACIDAKQRFVVDNTNLAAADRAVYITAARAAGFRVVGYYFRSVVRESLERNAQRTGPARIPDKGVFGAAKRLEPPRRDEGFDELYHVTIGPDNAFDVKDWLDETR